MSGPKCPNHKVPLTRTGTPGVGICPISNWRFAYKADASKTKRVLDLSGKVTTKEEWIVEGEES